jgi:hypothetical protein
LEIQGIRGFFITRTKMHFHVYPCLPAAF